jgi:glycosyltransferase involved in cell wall biosynthesis
MGLEERQVLYLSYNGMLEPLGQSQVLPYLRQLSKTGIRFTLLSFERDIAWTENGYKKTKDLAGSLSSDGIDWHRLRYHQRPSLPATVFDVLAGIMKGSQLVRSKGIEMVHARNHVPATIALALKRRYGLKFIFDLRGLMAEEYVDAGHWKQGAIPFRLTKSLERRAFNAADGLVTLTERIWPEIREWEGLKGHDVHHEVVPCCADLERFRFDPEDRKMIRKRLGLQDRFVVVYSGSIGGWYLTEEMADFFAALIQEHSDAHALWLTPTGHSAVRSLMAARGADPDRYSIVASPPEEVRSYLSAGDAGLAFIKPCFSKLASSPTKNAEYLACGLPVIINPDIGDSNSLVTEEGVGELVRSFSRESYLAAISRLRSAFADTGETRARTRRVAERLFDVNGVGIRRYNRLYRNVLDGNRLASSNVFSEDDTRAGFLSGS